MTRPISSGFKFALNTMGNFLVNLSMGFLASIILSIFSTGIDAQFVGVSSLPDFS
jgi:hypothetical protein